MAVFLQPPGRATRPRRLGLQGLESKAGERIRTVDIHVGNRRLTLPGTRKRRYRRGLRIASYAFVTPLCGSLWLVARCTPR